MNDEHRSNNFDFLRFVAALLVVWGHSYALAADGRPAPAIWGLSIHAGGLAVFFCISGYLVTQSFENTRSVGRFFWKRALRIFPAVIVCVVLCAVVLGPLVTRLSLGQYFSSPVFYDYFQSAALYIRYALPGVFDGNKEHAVNGSLWSLPAEFACYITLAVVGIAARKWLLLASGAVLTAMVTAQLLFMHFHWGPFIFYATNLVFVLAVAPYFFAGSVLSLLRVRFRPDVAFACIAVLSFATVVAGPLLLTTATWLLLPYIVLTLGTMSTPTLNSWGRFGDMSYGIYLYAFPIQQTIAYVGGGRVSTATMLFFSVPLSICAGWLSWHLIEKRALKFKSLRPPSLPSTSDQEGEATAPAPSN